MPPPDARRRTLLAEALSARRAELGPVAEPGQPPAAAPDAEEALRVLMVRLLPSVARPRATDAEVTALAHTLLELADAARGDDLRFLDAWNNAYEALAARPGLMRSAPAARVLALYADLLDHHVRRLAA